LPLNASISVGCSETRRILFFIKQRTEGERQHLIRPITSAEPSTIATAGIRQELARGSHYSSTRPGYAKSVGADFQGRTGIPHPRGIIGWKGAKYRDHAR
jgi:hypothetical protein